MAVEQKYLSFATIAGEAARLNDVQLLYMWHGQADRPMHTDEHCHDYWQLEIMTASGARIRLDGVQQRLRRGDLVIIPPQCMHRFDYQTGSAWLTVRYEVLWPCPHRAQIISERSNPLFAAFRSILSTGIEQVSRESGPSLRAAASALLLHLHQRPVEQRADALVQRVHTYVEQLQGRHISVAALAHELGFF